MGIKKNQILSYTTKPNKKPESKFEDVPEEVLTDPIQRTALGMDPIPGMNTPVNEPKVSTLTTITATATPEVKVFKNPIHPEFGDLRTIEIDGEPWFVGKDVTGILGYTNPTKALTDHVDEEDMTFNESLKLSRQRGAWLINESGLYSLILSSKLPSAKDFKHWVTAEVLPSIRKNGAYIRNQENMTPEQLVAAGLIAAQKIIESKEKG